MAQLRRFYSRVTDTANDAVTSPTVSLLRVGATVVRDASSGNTAVGCRHPGALKLSDVCYVIRNGAQLSGLTVVLLDSAWTYNSVEGDWEMEVGVVGTSYTPTAGDRLVLTGLAAGHKVSVYDNDTGAGSAGDPVVGSDGTVSGYVDAVDVDVKITSGGADTYVLDVGTEGRTFVTPEEFGAKGDGSTDDTNAIQTAIDYVGAVGTGGIVQFGDKTYNYTSLTMRSGVTLKGVGKNNTILVHTGTGVGMSRGSQTGPIQRWVLEDLKLTFTADTTVGLNFERFARGQMNRCWITVSTDFTGVVIQFGDGATFSAYYNQLISVDIAKSGAKTGTAVKFTTSGNENTLFGCKIDGFACAVDATGSAVNQIKLICNSIENVDGTYGTTDGAVKLGGTGLHVVAFNRFEGCGNCVMVDSAVVNGRNTLYSNSYQGVLGVQVQDNAPTKELYRVADGFFTIVRNIGMVEAGKATTPIALDGYKLVLQGDYTTSTVADRAFLQSYDLSASSNDPNGVITADFGSVLFETNTGYVWVKETATSSTGWRRVVTRDASSNIDLAGGKIAEMAVVTESLTGAATTAPSANTGFLIITGTGTAISKISGCADGRVLQVMFSNSTPNTLTAAATPANDEILVALSPTRYKVYTLVGWNDGTYTRWTLGD